MLKKSFLVGILALCFASPAYAQSTGGAVVPPGATQTTAPAATTAPVPASPQPKAQTGTTAPTPDPQDRAASSPKIIAAAQKKLTALGFYACGVDGIAGPCTLRSFCAFQLLTDAPGVDAPANLALLPLNDRRRLLHITRSQLRMHAKGESVFIRVSRRCQTLFLVKRSYVKMISPVSTGPMKPGKDSKGKTTFPTPAGHWRIFSKFGKNQIDPKVPKAKQIPGWDHSAQYEQAPMYLPLGFQGGKLIHGEPSLAYVMPLFASHGCVRMSKKLQKRVWAQVKIGTLVWVT